MSHPLCALMPFFNGQARLERCVERLLEFLPELSGGFRLCMVDDGSQDDSAEIARELAQRYPQIDLLGNRRHLGLAEALSASLGRTDAELIAINGDAYAMDPNDLRALWQLRDLDRRFGSAEHGGWSQKLLAWQPLAAHAGNRWNVIRRQAFEHFGLERAVELVHRVDLGKPAIAPPRKLTAPTLLDRR